MEIDIMHAKQIMTQTARRILGYRYLDSIVLIVGLLAYAALVLSTIGQWSIWFDEAYSAYIARFDLVSIAHFTAVDVHPPAYYWVLSLWTSLFGMSEIAIRSLSLVFGMIAISFGFLLVKRLFGRKAAWVGLLLLIVSPMLVRYGQEARMYTMAAAIVMAATYTLIIALHSKKRLPWVIYGVLIALGMWTHYFVAFAWIAHWIWRAVVVWHKKLRGKEYFQRFFTREWIGTHILAVTLFVPWIIPMFNQLSGIQSGWFWIGPVGADTLTNYLTTILFFRQHDQLSSWATLAYFVIFVLFITIAITSYRRLHPSQRHYYLLLAGLAIVPVIFVFLASLPPLRPSFIERYLMPSVASFSLFTGMAIAVSTAKLRPIFQTIIVAIFFGAMLYGVAYVQQIGNFNKTTGVSTTTRQVITEIAARSSAGEPIIARSPWIFYEAVFYETAQHPTYYLSSTVVGSISGSLDMLQGPDSHKIIDLDEFASRHAIVWYMGELGKDDQLIPDSRWTILQSVRFDDPVTGKSRYQAVQYNTGE